MENLLTIRENLHKIPELGLEEFKTSAYLQSILKEFSLLRLHTFAPTGIIAEYTANIGEPYLLFRADMDALPVTEKTDCPFASEHAGKMHACGHDIHMTILLGLIQKIVDERINKNFLFVFQPAEEGKGGAQLALESGILDKFAIKAVFALHVIGELPVGEIYCKEGIIFGIPQEFEITFHGKAAHAAFPQNGNDALLCAISFYREMLTLITRKFAPTEPVVFHVGKIEAGNSFNIVPEHCKLYGTIRILSKENREKIKTLAELTAENLSHIYDVTPQIKWTSTYDPVVNDVQVFKKFKTILPDDITLKNVEARMVGEDFGYFTSRYPGLLFWLGCGGGEDLHSSLFLPKAEAIAAGVKIFSKIAVEF